MKKNEKNLKKYIRIAEESNGLYSDFYNRADISATTFYRWIDKNSDSFWEEFYNDVLSILDIKRNELLDLSETKLQEMIEAGDFQAVKFYLSTVGKKRGYGNNIELDANIDADIKIKFSE